MNFPELYTIWVIRNKTPFFVGVKNSMAEAIDFGNKTVSTKEFEIKVFVNKDNLTNPVVPVVKAEPHRAELDLSKLSTVNVNDD